MRDTQKRTAWANRLGPILRKARTSRKQTARGVALAARIDTHAYARYERGQRLPDTDTFDTLCGIVGLDSTQTFEEVSQGPAKMHQS